MVHYLDTGDSGTYFTGAYIYIYIYENSSNCTLKYMQLIIQQSYLNQSVKQNLNNANKTSQISLSPY